MSKVFRINKPSRDMKPTRACLNCGKDISNKRVSTIFCCDSCWHGYNENKNHAQYLRERHIFDSPERLTNYKKTYRSRY